MRISEASEIACIIEAGTFKPGNIYPGKKGFLNLVVSAVLLGKTLERVCRKEIRLGQFIKEAVQDRKLFVPENTNLGIILLHVPIAVAASRGIETLGKTLDELVHNTTPEDAVECAKSLNMSGAFLGTPEKGPDVRGDTGMEEIRMRGMTLLDLFSISSEWDTIASEWVNKFSITFLGAKMLLSGGTVLELYMEILSEHPDSLVWRRFGKEKAFDVMKKAKELKDSPEDNLKKWDYELHKLGVNPGTTADLVASSLFVALLKEEEILREFMDRISQCGTF